MVSGYSLRLSVLPNTAIPTRPAGGPRFFYRRLGQPFGDALDLQIRPALRQADFSICLRIRGGLIRERLLEEELARHAVPYINS
jgi:hypothetical protein